MKYLIKLMDCIILEVAWICFIIYNYWSRKKDRTDALVAKVPSPIPEGSINRQKRHFVHLYTTNTKTGRHVCYMDVYKMNSPSDERKLRDACAGGVPTKTYLRYREKKLKRTKYTADKWLEYSTIAL